MVSVKLVCAAALLSLAVVAQDGGRGQNNNAVGAANNGKNGNANNGNANANGNQGNNAQGNNGNGQQNANANANAGDEGNAQENAQANAQGNAQGNAQANAQANNRNGQQNANANAGNQGNQGNNAQAQAQGNNGNANANAGNQGNNAAAQANNGNANANGGNQGQNADANVGNAAAQANNDNANDNANANDDANANDNANANANANDNANADADAANATATADATDPDGTALLANAIQTGSFSDGQDALGAEDTQVASQTSQNNFINFCAGQTLTNGLQITDGSCNGIVMGQIPAKDKMISSIITFPQSGQVLQEGQDFNITVQVNGLQAGAFTNAVATYYSAPQQLNNAGNVIGHTHVTVQDLGKSENPTTPPDPKMFAFFKGINDAGNGQGLLQAVVDGGLPAGFFRVCTLTSGSNHQPVIMPVAQRGSQDDCTKFQVAAAGQNQGQQNQGNQGQQNQGNQGQQNKGKQQGQRLARFARRAYVH